jgi:hypothetical protein
MEKRHAIPPGGFCAVHSLVGLREEVIEGTACGGQHGAADADGDVNGMLFVFEWLLVNGGAQAFGNLL